MNIEERIKVLEDEFTELKEEVTQVMLDIRTYLMEVNSPLRGDSDIDEFLDKSLLDRG